MVNEDGDIEEQGDVRRGGLCVSSGLCSPLLNSVASDLMIAPIFDGDWSVTLCMIDESKFSKGIRSDGEIVNIRLKMM